MYQNRRPNPNLNLNPNRKRGPGKPYQKPTRPITLTVSPGQVAFRLLCSIHAGSGVIGHSGSVVKRLYKETSARIHVDDAVSAACTERIVHVIGSETLDRWLRFDEESCFHVSAAQEGLIRVFERVLELETGEKAGGGGGGGGGGGEVVRCRLLVGGGLVGAVIGEGGRRIKKLVEESGAFIKIFSAELLPPCAASSDELVQITGGSLAVKKALAVVSQYIQQKALRIGRENEVTSTEILHMETNNVGVSGMVNEGVATKVVFRLLCPIDAASAVIGHKGRKIMALQDETGASITFSSREGDCNERVVTVSAIENRNSNHSSAQNAVVRVFNKSTSSGGRTARLLIQPNQVSLFKNGRPSNMAEIQKATGAELQILEHNGPFGASTNERVIQIEGEYSSVLTALFRVSWRLREHAFDSMVARDSGALLPHELFSLHPVQETATLTGKMNKCRISEEENGSLPHKLPALQFPNGHGLPTRMDGPRDLTTPNNSFELGSGITSVIVANTTVEIVVSEDMFGSVYGDGGSNLARLRLISGATVEVQDPCTGSEGKVIISGTPDQTLAAQSLLQAFIMAAK